MRGAPVNAKHPRRISKPTIACISGFCLGGGMALAMSAGHSHRIWTNSQFGIPAAKLGIAYGYDSLRNLDNCRPSGRGS